MKRRTKEPKAGAVQLLKRGGPKGGLIRTKTQKEADLIAMSRWMAKGYTVEQMYNELTAIRPYHLNFVTVWRDTKRILERWRLEAFHEIEEEKMRHLLKLEELEKIGWLWLEGKTEEEIKEVYEESVTPFGPETKKKVEKIGALRNVDRGISLLKWAMEERAKILGFYVSTNAKVQVAVGNMAGGEGTSAGSGALTITINSAKEPHELTRFPVIDAQIVNDEEGAEVSFPG